MATLWAAFLLILAIRANSQNVPPSITMLSRETTGNNIMFTCVAGPNVQGSAVTFIIPLGGIYNNTTPVSTYKSAEGIAYPRDTYDCDFEPGSACTGEWTRTSGLEVSQTSAAEGLHDLEPVTDERWESKCSTACSSGTHLLIAFTTYFSDNQKPVIHDFKKPIRNVGLSVRTSAEANILLCDENGYCYWIILNSETNSLALWTCWSINIKNPQRSDQNCNNYMMGTGVTLSEKYWKHIKLSISYLDNSMRIVEKNIGSERILLKSILPTIRPTQILLFIKEKNRNRKGIWKLYNYNYLSLRMKDKYKVWRDVGPSLKTNDKGVVCLTLYVATCTTCTLELRFKDLGGDPVKVNGNRSQDSQQWYFVKLESRNVPPNLPTMLQVLLTTSGSTEKAFWLIDNIKHCYENETRVISLETKMNPKDIISCQALQHPTWSSSIQGGTIVQPSINVCNNETYTGTNCAVSCMAALGTNCSRLMVCEPSTKRETPACTCAAGYQGEQCQNVCPDGYYGSGCNNKCDHCDGHCLPATGICRKTGSNQPTDTNDQHSESDSNPALYALLLLLLVIPVVAWLVYRKIKKPGKNDPHGVVSYTAVSTGPKITITTASPEAKPKTNSHNNFSTELSKKRGSLRQSNITPNVILNNEIQNKKPAYSKRIKIDEFSDYVKKSLENGELQKEFKLLPEGGTKPWTIGTSEENALKNRYKNLTAYDHSRVVLNKLPGERHSDFINASYIDGYKQSKAYIATQGPKKNTLDDFWRMIWQENVQCIVMITNLFEEGKPKCEKYWPDINNPQQYGMIEVTFLETDTYADFEYRIFKVKKDQTIRQVNHYHFTSWPDHGVPLYPQSLVPFLNRILTVSPAKAPIVVHCSAGIGRTGTIILADICLRMAAVENQIDVLKYFHSMREQRVNMVAKYDQYVLVYMVLLEYLLTPKTSYPCNELDITVQKIIEKGEIEKQMQHLKDTAWHNQVMGVPDTETIVKNSSKNRFPNIVPSGRRMYLSKYSSEEDISDYINAVPVDGFRIKNQFIVTQNPLPNTVNDFWRMIKEFNIKVIVSLNEIKNNKTSCKFWPSENEEMSPHHSLTIKCNSVSNETDYKIFKITLEDKSNNSTKFIKIIHFNNWKYENLTPAKEDQLIKLIDAAQKIPREDEPVVVTCYDGARASGLYVALSFIIEKIKLEHMCDVCLAVRTVRNNREHFVNDSMQFEFLYNAAVHYISTFELYSNFIARTK